LKVHSDNKEQIKPEKGQKAPEQNNVKKFACFPSIRYEENSAQPNPNGASIISGQFNHGDIHALFSACPVATSRQIRMRTGMATRTAISRILAGSFIEIVHCNGNVNSICSG
jgi:hypothetical protein